MKFVMSYSCGKDSTLALHKAMAQGHQAVALLVMINENVNRSYFHGASRTMLTQYEEALQIPMILCSTKGGDYANVLEAGLSQAKQMGADAACFGDIDVEENRKWEEDRCACVGLQPCFPLWQRGRGENVKELLVLGYQCLIKTVNCSLLPVELLGKPLDEKTIAVMRSRQIDICGENGEYHTLAINGPIFKQPLRFQCGAIFQSGVYAYIDIHELALSAGTEEKNA